MEYVSYKPPGPPEGTGVHRYVVVVMVAANGTTEALDLDVPSERRHWGYDGERSGVKEFAKRNGLKVIGESLCSLLRICVSVSVVLATILSVQTSMVPRATALLTSVFAAANFVYSQNDKQ
jgi:hypothetical protein